MPSVVPPANRETPRSGDLPSPACDFPFRCRLPRGPAWSRAGCRFHAVPLNRTSVWQTPQTVTFMYGLSGSGSGNSASWRRLKRRALAHRDENRLRCVASESSNVITLIERIIDEAWDFFSKAQDFIHKLKSRSARSARGGQEPARAGLHRPHPTWRARESGPALQTGREIHRWDRP